MYEIPELSVEQEFYFQWHITEKCNNRCKHCYQESFRSDKELPKDELLIAFSKMEDALNKWNLKGSVSLTGGEPFLRRDALYNLAGLLDNSNYFNHYDILTNGSLLSEEDLSLLKRLSKLRRIQLSLESSRPAENDSIRGSGSFDITLSSIRNLKSHGLQVSVMMTVTRNNKNEIPDMIDLLAVEGVDTLAIERFIPEGNGALLQELLISKEETKQLFELIYQVGSKEKRLRVLMHRPLFVLTALNDGSVGAICSVGINALTIMHDGTIYPCRRLPIPIGNIIRDGIFKPWYESELLWAVRNTNNLKGKCKTCNLVPLCRGCRAMAYWIKGDYLEEDPHCWNEIQSTS